MHRTGCIPFLGAQIPEKCTFSEKILDIYSGTGLRKYLKLHVRQFLLRAWKQPEGKQPEGHTCWK